MEGRTDSSVIQSPLPDFVQLVEAFGHHALRVSSHDELKEAVNLAFSEEYERKTVFVDVQVEPNVLVLPTQNSDSHTSVKDSVDS